MQHLPQLRAPLGWWKWGGYVLDEAMRVGQERAWQHAQPAQVSREHSFVFSVKHVLGESPISGGVKGPEPHDLRKNLRTIT